MVCRKHGLSPSIMKAMSGYREPRGPSWKFVEM
jgi:hypothetical protein